MDSWDSRYQRVLTEVFELYIRRRGDYMTSDDPGASLRRAERLGIKPSAGVLVRMADKFALAENHIQSGQSGSHDESLRETLLDISSYAVLAVLLLDEADNSGEEVSS